MWHNTRRGYNLIRKRKYDRNINLNILKGLGIVVCFTFVGILSISVYGIYKRSSAIKTISLYNEQSPKQDNPINIYEEDEPVYEEDPKTFTLVAIGELMMGGQISNNLNYNYMSAFKNVVEHTKNVDYTVTNLTTNITNLEKINNPKSKYIVTKSILNAFNALGVDAVNVASDHMLDFGKVMFNTTKDIIEQGGYNIIGLEDSIIYAEHDGIKVAFIGISNEIIGATKKYKEAGIFTYDLKKVKAEIIKAKQSAECVIVMPHLGSENKKKITDVMKWFYRELLDAGADMVLGSHALGIYPVEIYKEKPIIYSLGYFMHDTNSEIGKKAAIFKFVINENGKIEKLDLIPTYINDKKEVLLYSEYRPKDATKFLNSIMIKDRSIVEKVKDNMLSYEFKN